MSDIVYIADYMTEQILGGGELNDSELCKMIPGIEKKRCINVEEKDLINKKIIVSNFVQLTKKNKDYIMKNCQYVIYEHDHKYLKNRNPGIYKNFIAPKEEVINKEFYENAKKVFCQSSFHESVVKKNLDINNIVNLSGNLWSEEILEYIKSLSDNIKEDRYSILDSLEWHKNTTNTKFYCDKKKFKYELIKSNDYKNFLFKLSKNKHFIFIPQTPETLSRVIVEAKMMNVKVVTNKKVGASYEEWYNLKGEKLINKMLEKRKEILKKVMEVFGE
jgi:hypothetical protein